jgi:hypothetical protein
MNKAVSLTQPFATLIALGYKLNETRPRNTSHRGPLLIHASATRNKWSRDACQQPIIAGILERHGLTYDTLPRGVILCSTNLLDTSRISVNDLPWDKHPTLDPDTLTDTERACGGYDEGRWAWHLADVQQLPVPVPAKGSLSMWDATPALQAFEAQQG